MARLEDHPLPQRTMHWINLLCMIGLIVSGWYIHSPFSPGWMGSLIWLHLSLAFIWILNAIFRVYFAFAGSDKDWKEFAYTGEDLKNIIPQIKYYLFIGPHPHTGKYNPLQKVAYSWLLIVLFIFQATTGFALLWPTGSFAGVVHFFGGLYTLRLWHYFGMFAFIIFIIGHAYLSFTEAWDQVPLMFFGIAKKD
jgi:Ni/Fe-hydrogenase 1 B-type cytochrome subunit